MNTRSDDRFDAALRQTWREAADRLPGPLRLQLDPAIAAQRRAKPAKRAGWWLPAAGAFASFALAVALWWSPAFRQSGATPAVPGMQAVIDAAAVAVSDDDAVTELLTRNPDFYAWLGTEEGRRLAME